MALGKDKVKDKADIRMTEMDAIPWAAHRGKNFRETWNWRQTRKGLEVSVELKWLC